MAVVLVLGAPSAWSAEVVDVRVGRHADFTRIVFELDAPAGYRIERHEPAPGVAELVVTLDAGSTSRNLKTPKALIEGVILEPRGFSNSVALIRLKSGSLRLKEMILTAPPRIVLDVLPEAGAQTAAKSAPKAAPAAVPKPAPKAAPAAVPKPLAKATPEKPVQKRPAPRTTASPSAPTDVPASPAPSLAAPPLAEAVAPSDPGEPSEAAMAEGGAEPQQLAMATPSEMLEPILKRPAPPPVRPQPQARTPVSRPDTVSRPSSRPSPPPARRSVPDESGGFSLTTAALAVGGVAILAVAFLWMRRRRGGDEDKSGFFEDQDAPPNPFAEGEAPSAASDESPTRFDDSASEGVSMDPVTTATESSAPVSPAPPIVSGDSGDVMRLVRELERRVANLETRLDEVVDSKERLERQVVAQTEELRVQRAAIARTQRAVRNMSRPEEEGATEPALRDGDPPS